ncbi:MAG: class I SAM-dependent methyltransferase [Candidatus Berkelbacteria bacterium]|nr:class I SAM-dependent methyltransferase [Candidatus Berkelbacteria bacterium]
MKQELIQQCPICAQEKSKKILKVRDFRYRLNYYSYLKKCDSCDSIFLSPRPTKENIGNFYPSKYFDHGGKADSRKVSLPYREFYSIVKKMALEPGKVLDLGCGKGDLLIGLKNQGWQCYGTEISRESVEYARRNWGIKNVMVKDVERTIFESEYFDLIIMHHVLEHLYDPKTMIKKIKRWLKKDGILLLAVPNFNSLSVKIFKEKAFSLDVPRHLFQFTPNNLKKLIEGSGFKIKALNYFSLVHNMVIFRETIALVQGKKTTSKISPIDFLGFIWAYITALSQRSDTIVLVAQKTNSNS